MSTFHLSKYWLTSNPTYNLRVEFPPTLVPYPYLMYDWHPSQKAIIISLLIKRSNLDEGQLLWEEEPQMPIP